MSLSLSLFAGLVSALVCQVTMEGGDGVAQVGSRGGTGEGSEAKNSNPSAMARIPG